MADYLIIKATPSFETVGSRFKRANRRLTQAARESAQAAVQEYYVELKRKAPRGQHWDISGKRYETDYLAEGLRLIPVATGNQYVRIVAEGEKAAKHALWTIKGVRPHRIVPTEGHQVMTFFWPNVTEEHREYRKAGRGKARIKKIRKPMTLFRKGKLITAKAGSKVEFGTKVVSLLWVDHPGQAANPWHRNVFRAKLPAMKEEMIQGFRTKIHFELSR